MQELRTAPKGFTMETWQQFFKDGILIIRGALAENHAEKLNQIIQSYEAGEEFKQGGQKNNIVELHPEFRKLINWDAHIGHVYDVYGESLKLLQSQFFIRPPRQILRNEWHFDGPRLVPFEAFGVKVPLRIKVGYWLTDLPEDKMGNLIYIKGSHKTPCLEQYKTHAPHPQQESLKIKKGDMILMAAGLWHRVEENESQQTRRNIFLEYGPSWLNSSDRFQGRIDFLESLTREQRIVMREYWHPNFNIKPPKEDVALFNLREGEKDIDSANYSNNVPLHLRKHSTWLERNKSI